MALQRVRSNMLASDFVLTDGQGLRVGADNNLYIDTTNNRVGINTGAPDHELTVVGTVAATSFVGDGSQLTGVGASGLDTVTDVGNTTTNSITVGGLTVNSTSAARLPAGTTAERPAGSAGDIRFNSSLTKFEGYNGADWGGLGGGAAYASSAPATPQTGDLWFDTGTTGELYVYTGDEWISATGGGLTIFTSDDVPEGDDNLYYTTARANTDFDTRLSTKDTDDLAEGTNLYYTQARFDSAFTGKSTTDLTEGTRLYYTTARANSDFDSRLTLKTTTDLTEGSNLYYTDARVQTKLAAVSGSIVPDTDIAYDLGTPSKRFRELYLSGNSITIGTIRLTDNNGQFMVTDTSDNPVTAAEAENIIYDPTFSEIDAEDVQAALDIFGETRKYWSNITSAVRMYGGIIQNNGDGTVRVAGGGGLFKLEAGSVEGVPAGECEPMALNSAQGGEIFFRTWDADPVVELTNNAYNYIFIVWDHTYNNGDGTYGRARVHASTNFYMNDWENELAYYTFRAGHPELNLPERRSAMLHAFTVGRVYRMDNEIIVRVCGTNGWNYNKRAQLFGEEFFPVVRARGLEIEAASGDLQFNVTEGVMWAEAANRFTVQRFDMDDGDTFTAWYRHSAANFTGALADIQAAHPSGISGAPHSILYSTTDDRYYRYQNGSWSEVLDYVNSKVQISSSANLAALQSVYTDGFHNLDDGNDYVLLQLQATDAYYRYNSGNQTWQLFTGDIHDYVQVHFIGKVADMATQYPAGYTGLINVIAPTADGKYYEYNGANGWERVHGYVNRSGWLRFYDQTAVDVSRYNDVAAQKLVDLPAGEYGVAWIYMVHDNSCHLVYGQDYYTQEEAKNAALPTPLPGLLAAYSTLVGKITFTAGVTDFANASLESPFQEKFISSGVSLHNDLAGLNGGNASTNEYYHLDETAYNLLNTFAEEIDVDASGNLAVAGVVTSTGISTSGNVELTGVLRGPSTFTIDPAAHGDATGTVVIAGNLQVDGTTTTVNSTTVTIDDKNIVLADNASTAAEANGAGITINGAGAALTYTSADDRLNINKTLKISDGTGNIVIGQWDGSTNRIESVTKGLFLTTYDGSLQLGIDGTADVTITADRRVGIGTATPNQPFTVIGRANFDAQNNYYGAWVDGNTSGNSWFAVGQWYNVGGRVEAGGSDMHVYTHNTSHNLSLQKDGGKVGVGTYQPTHTLDVRGDLVVKGNTSSQHSVIRFRRSDSLTDFGYIGFETPNDANGNFLITSVGNGNPLKLQSGATDPISFFQDTVAIAQFTSSIPTKTDVAGLWMYDGKGIGFDQSNTRSHILYPADGYLKYGSGDGNGGIDITDTGALLMAGQIAVNSNRTFYSSAGDTSGYRLHTNSGITASNNYMNFFTSQSAGWSFNNNSTGADSNSVVSIDTGGNLTASGSVRSPVFYVGANQYWKTQTRNNADEWTVEYSNSGFGGINDALGLNIKFRVYSNGNALLAGTFTESSTRRIKENVRPITNALEVVNKLQGVIYDKIDGSQKDEPGLIAEDTLDAIANLVVFDDEGLPAGVKYTKTVAYLIEAVKELTAKVNALENK